MKRIILILGLVLVSLFSFGQLDIVKRTVTLDSLKPRGTHIYINGDTTLQDYIAAYSAATAGAAGSTGEIQFNTGGVLDASSNFTWNDNTLELVSSIGSQNVLIGKLAGYLLNSGTNNTFIGYGAGYTNFSGTDNTFIGRGAGLYNSIGNSNTFVGNECGEKVTGNRNTFFGYKSGYFTINADENVFIGAQSGYFNESGTDNIFIGDSSGYNETGSNKLYIENSNSSDPLIYGEFDNDLLKINGDLAVTGNINVDGYVKSQMLGIGAYINEDSLAVTDVAAADIWYFIGNDATSNKFSNIQNGNQFDFDGDTLRYIGNSMDSTCYVFSIGGNASQVATSATIDAAIFIKRLTDSDYTIVPQSRIGSFNKTSGESYGMSSSTGGVYLSYGTKIHLRIRSDQTGDIVNRIFNVCLRR